MARGEQFAPTKGGHEHAANSRCSTLPAISACYPGVRNHHGPIRCSRLDFGDSIDAKQPPGGPERGDRAWGCRLAGQPVGPTITSVGSPGTARTGGLACPSTSVCYLLGDDDSGNGYVLATTDSGGAWNALTLPPGTSGLNGIACPPPSTSTCYVTGSQNSNAFIIASTNSGATWSNVSVPSGLVSVSGIACPSLTNCYLIGYDPSESDPTGGSVIAATTDSGSSWSFLTFPSVFGPTGPIACPSTTTCFAGGNDSDPNQDYVITTTDSGAMWTQEGLPPDTSGFFGSPIACPSVTTCYLSALDLGLRSDPLYVFATTNSGNSWNPLSVPKNTGILSSIACPSTSVYYGGGMTPSGKGGQPGVGDIVVTTDSGSSWNDQIVPSGTSFLSSIVCPSTTVCFAEGSANRHTGGRGSKRRASRHYDCLAPRRHDWPALFSDLDGNGWRPSLPLAIGPRFTGTAEGTEGRRYEWHHLRDPEEDEHLVYLHRRGAGHEIGDAPSRAEHCNRDVHDHDRPCGLTCYRSLP